MWKERPKKTDTVCVLIDLYSYGDGIFTAGPVCHMISAARAKMCLNRLDPLKIQSIRKQKP